jgi:guanine deaminase
MDDPSQCPQYYRDESASHALEETAKFIDFVRCMPENDSTLIQPMVTPRFIPSCSDAALAGLGQIAESLQCRVQTHCSEGNWEHQFVIDRFGRSDTEMLKEFGLLRPGSILAHGNFITPEDMQILVESLVGIAHCPISNAYFSNAVFPLKSALDAGVRVGLGTDISGGPSPSIFENCRFAVAASRMLEDGVNSKLDPAQRGTPESRIDFKEALWLATAGGAQALDLPVGQFACNHQFDAILVDTSNISNVLFYPEHEEGKEDLLQKIIYNVSRSDIGHVWVDGRPVAGACTAQSH